MATAIKLQSIADFLQSRKMTIAIHWMLGICVALIALIQINIFPFLVALGGLVWFEVAKTLSDEGKLFHFTEWDRRNRGTYFSNSTEYWSVIGASVVAVIFSLFVYVPLFFSSYNVVDKGDTVLYENGWFITPFNPFVDTVRNYSSDQTVSVPGGSHSGMRCKATTADGKGVEAAVAADLSLPFDGLKAAHTASNGQGMLTRMVQGELCARFASTIGRYALAQIPTFLVLESNTADEKRGMNEMGVRYSGLVRISKMHAYAGQAQ